MPSRRIRSSPHSNNSVRMISRGLAVSELSTYPLETLWDDGEFILSRSLPDSEGKRMSKAYLQVPRGGVARGGVLRRARRCGQITNFRLGESHDPVSSRSAPILYYLLWR